MFRWSGVKLGERYHKRWKKWGRWRGVVPNTGDVVNDKDYNSQTYCSHVDDDLVAWDSLSLIAES